MDWGRGLLTSQRIVHTVAQLHGGAARGLTRPGAVRNGTLMKRASSSPLMRRASCRVRRILALELGQGQCRGPFNHLRAPHCYTPHLLHTILPPPPYPQVRVFRPATDGVRRCIVATNVAETSITGG